MEQSKIKTSCDITALCGHCRRAPPDHHDFHGVVQDLHFRTQGHRRIKRKRQKPAGFRVVVSLGRWCLLQRKLDRRRDQRREVVRLLDVFL